MGPRTGHGRAHCLTRNKRGKSQTRAARGPRHNHRLQFLAVNQNTAAELDVAAARNAPEHRGSCVLMDCGLRASLVPRRYLPLESVPEP